MSDIDFAVSRLAEQSNGRFQLRQFCGTELPFGRKRRGVESGNEDVARSHGRIRYDVVRQLADKRQQTGLGQFQRFGSSCGRSLGLYGSRRFGSILAFGVDDDAQDLAALAADYIGDDAGDRRHNLQRRIGLGVHQRCPRLHGLSGMHVHFKRQAFEIIGDKRDKARRNHDGSGP